MEAGVGSGAGVRVGGDACVGIGARAGAGVGKRGVVVAVGGLSGGWSVAATAVATADAISAEGSSGGGEAGCDALATAVAITDPISAVGSGSGVGPGVVKGKQAALLTTISLHQIRIIVVGFIVLNLPSVLLRLH